MNLAISAEEKQDKMQSYRSALISKISKYISKSFGEQIRSVKKPKSNVSKEPAGVGVVVVNKILTIINNRFQQLMKHPQRNINETH